MDHAPTADHRAKPDLPALDKVIAYWQGLRHGRIVPARTDLDPAALQPWLSGAGIVERGSGGRIRLRLAGRAISALMGVEARGMPLRAMFAVAARARLTDLSAAVFDGPQALSMTLIAEAADPSAPPLTFAMVLLPLGDQTGAVTRALICLSPQRTDHDGVARPCRFHIRQAHLTALSPAPRLAGVRVERAGAIAPALRLIPGGRG